MYNKDYYPSTEKLIQKMIEKQTRDNLLKCTRILECSAGDGRIITQYKDYYNKRLGNGWSRRGDNDLVFDAIEIDDNLSNILRGKNINVIWNDFLTFQPNRFYDLIISNMPFSIDVDCMLKAISIQQRIGGKIIAVINAQTIKHPYSNKRKELATLLEKYNADIEYLQDEFIDAERRTEVEVALITIDIPMEDMETLFEKEFKRNNIDLEYENFNTLIPKMNKLESLCFECQTIKKSVEAIFKEKMKVDNMLKGMGLNAGISICNDLCNPKKININEYFSDIDIQYWQKFIEISDFKKKLPSKLKDSFNNMIEKQRTIEFCMENIKWFYEKITEMIPQSYEENCNRIFDELTVKSHYSDKEWCSNIHMFNGWKTNQSYKIGKKNIVSFCRGWYLHNIPSVITDLVIVLENLSGIRNTLDNTYIKDQVSEYQRVLKSIENYEKNIDCYFFTLDVYKKGTIHIKYKEEYMYLIEAFNIIVNKYKTWLPDGFGTKNYSDMTKEEIEVINNFGIKTPEHYQKYIGRKDYLRLMA